MKKVKLYLDDRRTPKTNGWIIVRDYHQFVDWINQNGLPDEISFDHDLSHDFNITEREYTGYDAAKWLCNYCEQNGLPLPEWWVHSANPVGRININQLLENYKVKHDRF